MKIRFIALAVFLGLAGATGAQAQTQDPPLDIEVKEVDVRNIFSLLAEVRGAPIQVDPCVQAKIDLKLKNTPISMVLTALGSKLHLVYEERGSELHVACARDGGAPAPAHKISMAEASAALPVVLEKLAKENALAVDYRATKKPAVTLTVENASLGAVLGVLADESELSIAVKNGKIVVSDR